jgi:phage/plasmid-like protein (TIGR03299 family)
MFAVGERTWHGEEILLADAPTIDEAIRMIGADRKVHTRPIYDHDANELAHYRAVWRDGCDEPYAVMSDGWTPVQDADAFRGFQPLLDAGLKLETGATLANAARVFLLAKLGEASVGGDDSVKQYVLFANGHDGTLSVRLGLTNTRVVCQNTLAVALGADRGSIVRLAHTKNVMSRLADAQATITAIVQSHAHTIEQYRYLASMGITDAQMREYVESVFKLERKAAKLTAPAKDDFTSLMSGGFAPSATASYSGPGVHEVAEPVLAEQGSRVMREILERFETGAGADLPTARGTWWGAYNAVTDYMSHGGRNRSWDARANSNLFGTGADVNARALASAVRMAAA